jgi:hypothetical protein
MVECGVNSDPSLLEVALLAIKQSPFIIPGFPFFVAFWIGIMVIFVAGKKEGCTPLIV